MPKIKTGVRGTGRVKHSLERIELIDQLLVKYKHIPSRKDFLAKVNNKLPFDNKISIYTLDNDIEYLRAEIALKFGDVRLEYSKESGFHYSQAGFSLFKNTVTDEDQHLLMLANSLFNVFKGTPLKEKFSLVVNKVLAESLTGDSFVGIQELNHIQVEPAASSKSIQWIPVLLEAIYEKNSLEMKYKGFNKPEKKKIICPYVLKQYRNRWYMVAYDYDCERAEKTNVFSLDAIEHLEISNKKYFIDPTFNAADYFRYCIGVWHWHKNKPIKVRLEFNGYIEMVQATPLHHSQKIKTSTDGKKLTVKMEVYNSPELEMMIKGFGNAVKVISPKALTKSIAVSAHKVVLLY